VAERKRDHLHFAVRPEMESATGPGWTDIHLVHQALPAADLDSIDVRVDLLGHSLKAPLLIAAMTGGHPEAAKVNRVLASAAERHGIAMGLGSQRAAIRQPHLASTYAIAREVAPTALLIANVGAAQLVHQRGEAPLGAAELRTMVDMIGAQALAIHLNFLEEVVQPEGDRRVAGLEDAIAAAVAASHVPAIAKETGGGISNQVAIRLVRLGFSALDVGGRGGTSFAAIEQARATVAHDARGILIGSAFRDWGIPTAASLIAARNVGVPLIATGGVRSGLDAAKAIALGASVVGVARPLLVAALESSDAVDVWIGGFIEALKVAIFLTGGRTLSDLANCERVITGPTSDWARGLRVET
jgi:isopentenyl-diphosphate delta-isomerase